MERLKDIEELRNLRALLVQDVYGPGKNVEGLLRTSLQHSWVRKSCRGAGRRSIKERCEC